ncbi:MAG: signal recognition particle-docking protein FtsY [bacterium]|nr:signal recognition particle-docking protein FtsY [bacterium]
MFKTLIRKIDNLFNGRVSVDEEMLDELEELLIQSDISLETVVSLVDPLRETNARGGFSYTDEVRTLLAENISRLLHSTDGEVGLRLNGDPAVILITGVNGSGKTTATAKLSALLKKRGLRVLVAAADTFRAAAIDQLAVWCNRAGVELIKHQEGADPGAVVFDALNAARARNADVVLIDTAGRLHNKANLMEELKKISRIIVKVVPEGSSEVLLALDATTGQNSVNQARLFKEAVDITGLILNKVDGTAKGGAVLSIVSELKLPVKYLGTGEKMEDIVPFDPDVFARELAGLD